MMTRIWALLLFVCILLPLPAWSQTSKHPRVAEIEKTLAREGLELLKGRFPDKPFLIKVQIDPLFRERPRGKGDGEKLPYLDVADDEIVDEWDDPNLSNEALLNRVTRIHVDVSVPSNLSDDELSELKGTLMSNLGMLAGRDSVEIAKRSWGSQEKEDAFFNRNTIAWSVIGWILFSSALLGAAWLNTSRLSNAFRSAQKTGDKAAPAAAAAPAPMMAQEPMRPPVHQSGGGGPSGDIRFMDPIKNREMIQMGLRALETQKGFPCLEDMVLLHRFGEESPAKLGALLSEFPAELRAKVFSYSHGDFWLQGLSDPGELDFDCVDVLNRCTRVQRKENERDFEELLILIWRLETKSAEFFRGLDQTEAFSLLFDLPKKISLAIARSTYPGSWGLLLNQNFKPEKFSPERISFLRARALAIHELRDPAALVKFKKETDLLEFLRFADPPTEKDVYVAAGSDSILTAVRPPFYKVLEMSELAMEKLVPMMRIEDWALALFNTNRDSRKGFEAKLSEKQRFRFIEMLRAFDSNPPAKEMVGDVRERAGRLAADIEKHLLTESVDALNALTDLDDLDSGNKAA